MNVNTWFVILTIAFIVVAAGMILIILVQRPQGGGLAAAFGGAGGGGTDSVFGGRVGDALTWATVVAFILYLGLALGLNLVPARTGPPPATPAVTAPVDVPLEGEADEGADAGGSETTPAPAQLSPEDTAPPADEQPGEGENTDDTNGEGAPE
jgi:preprotein translocase subunit SecG